MKLRTWPILAVSFGTLIVLMALSGGGALRRAQEIFGDISGLHENYRRSERVLNQVQSEIHLSGVLVRDYLLDPSNIAGGRYREELLSMRSSMAGELDELSRTMSLEDAPKLASLRQELDGYWASLDPMFEWTPQQKIAISALFLRKQVLPRREAALSIAREIAALNQANLERQRRQVNQKQSELPQYVSKMLAITILLGVMVAAGSIFRTSRLERRAELERRRTELAEQELRRLSQELVRAQEEERRSISRELHDEVGQMLTALRMELRSLEQLRSGPAEQFQMHLEDGKALSEKALRAVRDLAMGLRPSMLDDLGLGPAIEWQGREFSRRYGIPVTVQTDGVLTNLTDRHRTCVYRVVQEALTNCARHAHAREIRITVYGGEDWVSVAIQDDGQGFQASEGRGRGLGLVGMEERVRELDGEIGIFSQPGKGTVLTVKIPLQRKEAALA